jgi:hypothetical protein
MYKLDRNISKSGSFEESEQAKKFNPEDSVSERLRQAWYLTCMVYGIDYNNPPKMEKKLFSVRKHQQ